MGVEIYTDGAAKGNPGNGGYGVVLFQANIEKKYLKGLSLQLTIEWSS